MTKFMLALAVLALPFASFATDTEGTSAYVCKGVDYVDFQRMELKCRAGAATASIVREKGKRSKIYGFNNLHPFYTTRTYVSSRPWATDKELETTASETQAQLIGGLLKAACMKALGQHVNAADVSFELSTVSRAGNKQENNPGYDCDPGRVVTVNPEPLRCR